MLVCGSPGAALRVCLGAGNVKTDRAVLKNALACDVVGVNANARDTPFTDDPRLHGTEGTM